MEEREKKETVAKVAVHPSYLKHRKIQIRSMKKNMVQKRSGMAFDRCADTKDAVWEWTRDDAKIIFPLFSTTCHLLLRNKELASKKK